MITVPQNAFGVCGRQICLQCGGWIFDSIATGSRYFFFKVTELSRKGSNHFPFLMFAIFVCWVLGGIPVLSWSSMDGFVWLIWLNIWQRSLIWIFDKNEKTSNKCLNPMNLIKFQFVWINFFLHKAFFWWFWVLKIRDKRNISGPPKRMITSPWEGASTFKNGHIKLVIWPILQATPALFERIYNITMYLT